MIAEQLKSLNEMIAVAATSGGRPMPCVVLVSKFIDTDRMLEAYAAGQRVFGESRVQELIDKMPRMPQDIVWHLIGHLQTNKAKYIVGKVALIHSVDSVRLASEIDRIAAQRGIVQGCLLQCNVSGEGTKSGFVADTLAVAARDLSVLKNVCFRGLMTIASNVDDQAVVRADFRTLKELLVQLQPVFGPQFVALSMGMSHDWQLAIEEGSTMVRIGSAVFGERGQGYVT